MSFPMSLCCNQTWQTENLKKRKKEKEEEEQIKNKTSTIPSGDINLGHKVLEEQHGGLLKDWRISCISPELTLSHDV